MINLVPDEICILCTQQVEPNVTWIVDHEKYALIKKPDYVLDKRTHVVFKQNTHNNTYERIPTIKEYEVLLCLIFQFIHGGEEIQYEKEDQDQ